MKIFLCSTSFDLEDLRALIVDKFGDKHEFIRFEDAAFPSRRGLHSHDQCIEAVKQSDVVLCIIDKRYGGFYRGDLKANFPDQKIPLKTPYRCKTKRIELLVPTKELSITWCELMTAYQASKYVITFARQRTLDEKATRRKNQTKAKFTPAHVDDNHVFDLLDWITKQQKDNWIIPFHNAVDCLDKLAKWLSVADATIVQPTNTVKSIERQPIVVIVEGQSDAKIVKAVVEELNLITPVSLVVAEGKRALLSALKIYTRAFKEATGIVVLADADTTDTSEIESQKNLATKIIEDSDRPDTRIILIMPEIESWLGMNFKSPSIKNFGKLPEQLSDLQKNLEQRGNAIPSLAEFIETLQRMDKEKQE